MNEPEEYYNFEERVYEAPTQSRDEQMSFIDNLRAVQQANNAQIKTQTENLGTRIPSVKGGLTGPEGYFQQRYQVTPTNALVADLKAAAQADALNKVLSNYGDQMQKRYNDAYRRYQKNRAKRAAANRGSGSGTGGSGGGSTPESEIETIASDTAIPATSSISSAPQSGWSDTSYTDLDGRVHRVYTDASGHRIEYIGNDKVYDDTKEGIMAAINKKSPNMPSFVDIEELYDTATNPAIIYDPDTQQTMLRSGGEGSW